MHLLEQHWLSRVHAAFFGWQVEEQIPFTHVCPTGQVIGVNTQPVAGAHVSVVQVLLSLQVMAVCEQKPPEQLSVVHALESLQLIGVNTQPVAGAHASVVQALLSLQVMAVKTQPDDGLQLFVVQALLSLQVMLVCVQVPALHTSVVHALLSSQSALKIQFVIGLARFSELITSIRP